MKRHPLTTHATAGHPIRRMLSPPKPMRVRVREEDQDLKLFVLSFTAFFVVFYSFIA